MSPVPIRSYSPRAEEPSTSLSREASTMHIQLALHPRSTDGSSDGVQANTIIFIVVGIVCFFVILAGFYLVSHSRAVRRAAAFVSGPNVQQSPTASTHPPSTSDKHNKSTSRRWKIWKTRHSAKVEPPAVVEVPTLNVSTCSTMPSPTMPARAMTHPPITPRPSQERRVTSLSVTTSFSHSHITQEALNDFCVSAYDLDGDLETEMLNSARDDVWAGLPLAMEESCGPIGGEECTEARGNTAHTGDGSAQSYVPLMPAAQRKGSDYENSDACQRLGLGGDCVGGDSQGG